MPGWGSACVPASTASRLRPVLRGPPPGSAFRNTPPSPGPLLVFPGSLTGAPWSGPFSLLLLELCARAGRDVPVLSALPLALLSFAKSPFRAQGRVSSSRKPSFLGPSPLPVCASARVLRPLCWNRLFTEGSVPCSRKAGAASACSPCIPRARRVGCRVPGGGAGGKLVNEGGSRRRDVFLPRAPGSGGWHTVGSPCTFVQWRVGEYAH